MKLLNVCKISEPSVCFCRCFVWKKFVNVVVVVWKYWAENQYCYYSGIKRTRAVALLRLSSFLSHVEIARVSDSRNPQHKVNWYEYDDDDDEFSHLKFASTAMDRDSALKSACTHSNSGCFYENVN